MVKVITYGTYDLLHYGHIKLLERAKALGDYLIVGVTADDFDKTRGKLNVQQSLIERIEAVRATGIADKIIVEEYEGQKIDDIRKYNIDIFTVGSDWIGKFDYLDKYCRVVYLERTEGISSTKLRTEKKEIKIGVVANDNLIAKKFMKELKNVNGLIFSGIYITKEGLDTKSCFKTYQELLEHSDAVYVLSDPDTHYRYIKEALSFDKHIICESPIALSRLEYQELKNIANEKGLILFDAIKTAYSTAFYRLLLQVKTGVIGEIVYIDATCTSLDEDYKRDGNDWNSIYSWGPIALLPIFSLFGTQYSVKTIISKPIDNNRKYDLFTNIHFVYKNAVANIKVGKGIKSEGQLIISGTKGYMYVPSPWWKTDYFEVRYENANENKKFFYKLEGEGIREELVAFTKSVSNNRYFCNVSDEVSAEICDVMNDFKNKVIIELE